MDDRQAKTVPALAVAPVWNGHNHCVRGWGENPAPIIADRYLQRPRVDTMRAAPRAGINECLPELANCAPTTPFDSTHHDTTCGARYNHEKLDPGIQRRRAEIRKDARVRAPRAMGRFSIGVLNRPARCLSQRREATNIAPSSASRQAR